jgi:hypothetical protein
VALAFDHEDHQLERDALKFHRTRLVQELKASGVKLKVSEVPPCGAQKPSSASFYTPRQITDLAGCSSFRKASDQLHRRSIHS